MGEPPSVKKYPFRDPRGEAPYNQFPAELEEDGLVFFHGTAAVNLKSILADGFRPPDNGLKSVSSAATSDLALNYACDWRSAASPDGCILAVKFEQLDRPGIHREPFGLHVYKFDPQPTVIGYCIVPAGYRHV